MTRMTFDQAVDFIVEGLDVPEHARRATRDKVRKRVRYGLGDGSLPRMDLQTTDVDRTELILWSRIKWPGKFTEFLVQAMASMSDHMALGAENNAFRFPSDIEDCHACIQKLASHNRLLQVMLQRQDSVIAELKPLAEQYERNRAKNRAAARKPRR